jgi:hypothetical protein
MGRQLTRVPTARSVLRPVSLTLHLPVHPPFIQPGTRRRVGARGCRKLQVPTPSSTVLSTGLPTVPSTMLRIYGPILPPVIPPIIPPITPPISGVLSSCVTRLVWSPVNHPAPKLEQDVAAGEPAFIQRLPAGVEYTLIKTIFIDLPSGLPTLLWAASSESTSLLRTFNERTVRAIVRVVRREEKSETNREFAALIRHELVQLCLAELNSPWSPHPELSLSVRLVAPHLFGADHRPPGPSVQHVRITVESIGSAGSTVLDERFVASTPAAWNASIPFIDSEECDRIILDLVAKHFARLLNVRVSARWRSKYSPEGWQLITQHIVPRLYEYLRPFYSVRQHRRAGRSGPAKYSAQLRRDITDMVRFELPHLAKKLTLARVTAAIQRYTARQHSPETKTTRKRPKQ